MEQKTFIEGEASALAGQVLHGCDMLSSAVHFLSQEAAASEVSE